ncbi:hypothetical protein MNBD_NITROSPINAE04-1960 [hydrothermal vent metagenome]|uniref:Tip attachment protein J domain-containing protein n=1 Tax=hydrothermal vent metagenome TaxID=652676 RepID=A0A3B1CEY8_9ZZZZ
MKTFSAALDSALQSTVKQPVWLLKLDLVSTSGDTTLYLADQPITLWGQSWKPLVTQWGVIDRFFDPSEYETKVSDVTVELDNRPQALGSGMKSLSWYFRKYDLSASTATFYMWLNNAGLTEPSGNDLNDLLPILSGTPELSTEITPAICPLDIVTKEGEWADDDCPWGALLNGRYTRYQWGALPEKQIGDFKPMVFGANVLCEGTALTAPERVGEVTGPDELFDPALGAEVIVVSFPKSGDNNEANPYPAPCDMYIGDWRFTIKAAPTQRNDLSWEYRIDSQVANGKYYVPTPLKGTSPLFSPATELLWPKSNDTNEGPFASDEPARGAPYQFFHGVADTGNSRDGYNPGRAGSFIDRVYVNGAEVNSSDMKKDDSFGIVWLRGERGAMEGKVGNPEFLNIKYTAVDNTFTSGDTWLRPTQLTANYPYGFQAGLNPCILGDFAIPASGGGAPASSRLGLKNSINYPHLGARVAAVRFVMKYTGLEYSTGTFNLELFGNQYSFNITELDSGSGIASQGFWVVKNQRGVEYEIWENNDGFPYTATSPDPRFWDMYELSKDVTTDALNHLKTYGGFADSMKAWVSGTAWPFTNSLIVLTAELEIQFEPVETTLKGPRVTALIGNSSSKAGEILSSIIPSNDVGSGFDDSSLPDLKYRIDKQQSICRFVRTVTRESNTELKKNFSTGKYDLVKKSDSRDNFNPAPPTGGVANINQDNMLADGNGLPMIQRLRSAPEAVVNEVTVRYIDEDGENRSVTIANSGSVDTYGVKRYVEDLGAAMTREAAEDRALDILNANAELNDYYMMSFPLGSAIALEPNDILQVTADMDELTNTKMRVVSVEVDPGHLAFGKVASITVNAQRYSKARRGFGQIPLGQGPFGSGQILEN